MFNPLLLVPPLEHLILLQIIEPIILQAEEISNILNSQTMLFQSLEEIYNPSIFNDPGPFYLQEDFLCSDEVEIDNSDFCEHNIFSKFVSHFPNLLSIFQILEQIKTNWEVVLFFLPLLGINIFNEKPSQVININNEVNIHIHIDNSESAQDNDIDTINEFINESLLQEL